LCCLSFDLLILIGPWYHQTLLILVALSPRLSYFVFQ
jgi:hypothetical protein